MRFLFLGTEPGTVATKALADYQVSIEAKTALGGLKLLDSSDFDLIVFAPRTMNELSELKGLRRQFPKAWLVVLAKTSWLNNESNRQQLTSLVEKNEVWNEESWQLTFPFFLQAFVRRHEMQRHTSPSEIELLKAQCEELNIKVANLADQLEQDVELAANVHRALLPKVTPKIPGFNIDVRYVPAAGTGGDYYDIFEFGDRRRFGIVLADSKSHGMAASLLGVLVKVRLEEMKDRFPDSKSFVSYLHHEITLAHKKEVSYLSLLYGILDRAGLTFKYTSAGHLRPILCRLGEVPQLDLRDNPALGSRQAGTEDFKEITVPLQPGDQLVFFTDGWEPLLSGDAGKRVRETLVRHANQPTLGTALTTELMGIADAFKVTSTLRDDLTLIQVAVQDKAIHLVPTK